MRSYVRECPWCGQQVQVSEGDESILMERHQVLHGHMLNRERVCTGSGEIYIDIWEEAVNEADAAKEAREERLQDETDFGPDCGHPQ